MLKTKLTFQINGMTLIFLGIIIALLCSCNYSGQISGKENQGNQIVLIISDTLSFDFLRQQKASLKYINDESLPVTIGFFGDSITNHWIIPTDREMIELVYKENSQSLYSFLFQKGDTLLLSIHQRNPWIKTINRETTPYQDNMEVMRNRELYPSNYTKLQDFYFLWNSNVASVTPLDLKDELNYVKNEAKNSLNAELSWIDSLGKAKLVSEKVADFYSSKARFELEKLKFFDVDNGKFDTEAAIESILGSEWDSPYNFKNVYMNDFVDFLLTSKAPDILSRQESVFTKDTKTPFGKAMLFKYLEQSLPFLSFAEAEVWLNRYEPELTNKAQFDFLKARNSAFIGQKADMDLMGLGKNLTVFEEVLQQKKGNYLYIDLWAAWCIPCIRSFPASLALHEDYNDLGFEVVYLSIDKNNKFWESVVEKYHIAIPNRSFVVMNLEESEFLNKLNVDLIPRYLIFDKEGKLIHQNAPKPDSKELRVLLESLLFNSN